MRAQSSGVMGVGTTSKVGYAMMGHPENEKAPVQGACA